MRHLIPSVLVLGGALAAACGSARDDGSAFPDAPADAGTPVDAGPLDDAPLPPTLGDGGAAHCTTCTDFPPTPILDAPDAGAAAPANSADLFGAPGQGAAAGGPCLVEPEIHTLYPNNWLRPRFRWSTAQGQNLFELRLHVGNQKYDLAVYTTSTSWTMPKAMWDALRAHSADQPMTVSVRGGIYGGGALTGVALGSTGPIGIAPVSAAGAIVYWGIDSDKNTAWLKGFSAGDESVELALAPQQAQPISGQATQCIGCHAATPDGKFAAYQASGANWGNGIGSVVGGAAGQLPPFLSFDAETALGKLQGAPTFSPKHWSPGDRIEILSDTGDLHWVSLDATGADVTGVIPRGPADTGKATGPSFSHDGMRIVYATSPVPPTGGRATAGPIDIYTMHYNAKAGGDAAPLLGASLQGANEYYPAFSPDDAWVTFTRSDASLTSNTYADPHAEIWAIPSTGGTALRLAANDPPACAGSTSPGAQNSWSKWAPSVETYQGRTFYWVIFSSNRWDGLLYSDGRAKPQLFITALEIDSGGTAVPHGALYLWNQPDAEHNHLPAWDNFEIPPVPPPR